MNIEILNYVIPVATIFLSYFLGSVSSKNNDKMAVQRQRYEEFYVPFMKLLITYSSFPTKNSTIFNDQRIITENERKEHYELLLKYIHFLGKDSSVLMPNYLHWYDLSDESSKDSTLLKTQKSYESAFSKLSQTIVLEAESLSKEIKYPNLPRTILNSYYF